MFAVDEQRRGWSSSASAAISTVVASASTTKTGISSATDFFPASVWAFANVHRRFFATPRFRWAAVTAALSCARTSALSSQCTLRATTFPEPGPAPATSQIASRRATPRRARDRRAPEPLRRHRQVLVREHQTPQLVVEAVHVEAAAAAAVAVERARAVVPPHVPEAPVEPGDAESMYTNTDTRR